MCIILPRYSGVELAYMCIILRRYSEVELAHVCSFCMYCTEYAHVNSCSATCFFVVNCLFHIIEHCVAKVQVLPGVNGIVRQRSKHSYLHTSIRQGI